MSATCALHNQMKYYIQFIVKILFFLNSIIGWVVLLLGALGNKT